MDVLIKDLICKRLLRNHQLTILSHYVFWKSYLFQLPRYIQEK